MRPNSSHYSNGPSKNALPLTPPMSSDISFDGRRSPSSRSPTSSQDYFHESTPPADEGRRLPHTAGSTPRSHVAQASYSQRSYAPTYATQPPPPMQPNGPGPYYQRPLPAVCSAPLYPPNVSLFFVQLLTCAIDFPSYVCFCAFGGCLVRQQPVATPPLHLANICRILSPVSGSLHLPDLQQGLLAAELSSHPQPLPYRREAFQVPPQWMRQGLQCPEQHEASRARLPQL